MKVVFSGIAILFLAVGCAHMANFQEREKMYGNTPPAITASFASQDIRPGEAWKIYLRASDPNGDMNYILATIDQPGMGTYPVSRTRIGRENGKEVSGYVYLNTMTPSGYTWQNYVTLTLTIRVGDQAGHWSDAAVFPLAFDARAVQETPTSGSFPEKNLGPIMITLKHYATDGQDGFE